MTTVKVEARGWIFLHHPLFPLSADLAEPFPSTCLLLLQPSFPLTCHKKTLLGSASATTGKYFNRSPFDKWLEIRLEAHITFENKCLNFIDDKISGLPTLIRCKQFLNKHWCQEEPHRPTSYKPHTSWILYTCISDQWQLWILHWSSFYRWALPPPLQLVSVGLKVDNFQ